MKKRPNNLLKVSGILMIIGGGLGIVIGIIAVLGMGVLAITFSGEKGMGLLVAASFLVLISAIVSVVAGVLGVVNAAVPEKAKVCIVFGVITLVFALLSSALSMVGGNKFNVISLLTGVILPVIYLMGAFQNKKIADSYGIDSLYSKEETYELDES